jgi:hypothetical protein
MKLRSLVVQLVSFKQATVSTGPASFSIVGQQCREVSFYPSVERPFVHLRVSFSPIFCSILDRSLGRSEWGRSAARTFRGCSISGRKIRGRAGFSRVESGP